jgi:hypothetical protein
MKADWVSKIQKHLSRKWTVQPSLHRHASLFLLRSRRKPPDGSSNFYTGRKVTFLSRARSQRLRQTNLTKLILFPQVTSQTADYFSPMELFCFVAFSQLPTVSNSIYKYLTLLLRVFIPYEDTCCVNLY